MSPKASSTNLTTATISSDKVPKSQDKSLSGSVVNLWRMPFLQLGLWKLKGNNLGYVNLEGRSILLEGRIELAASLDVRNSFLFIAHKSISFIH